MTMPRLELITSVQRRRRWSRAEKERIVAAALEPGAVASAVARQAGIHTSQLFRWRKQLCSPAFVAVQIAPEPVAPPSPPTAPGLIEVEFAAGARVRICGQAEPATVAAVMSALMGGRR